MGNTTLITKIALVNKTTAEWAVETTVPIKGCPCVEWTTDGKSRLKIGDGTHAFAELPYESTPYDDAELRNMIGTLSTLETVDKTSLVNAVNELKTDIDNTNDASKVTITSSTEYSDYAKVYTVSQNGTTIGTINVPKDMFVSSGEVVTNPVGKTEGTYIELTLANATNDKIYINVNDLMDVKSITTGDTDGTIKVDNVEVAVAGLDTMAYESKTDYVNVADTLTLNCTL